MSEKIIKVVDWCIAKKFVIKFQDEENSIKIDEKITIPTIRKNDKVTVIIDKVDNKDIVISIEKNLEDKVEEPKTPPENQEKKTVKEEVPTTEKTESQKPSTEKTQEQTTETKILTVSGVWTNKICFKEGEYKPKMKWVFVDEKIAKNQEEIIKAGLTANTKCEFTFTNDIVTAFKILETPKVEKNDNIKETKTKSSYRDEDATDRRTASMNAKDIVVALINTNQENVNNYDKIEKIIEQLTQKFYEVTKKL